MWRGGKVWGDGVKGSRNDSKVWGDGSNGSKFGDRGG